MKESYDLGFGDGKRQVAFSVVECLGDWRQFIVNMEEITIQHSQDLLNFKTLINNMIRSLEKEI